MINLPKKIEDSDLYLSDPFAIFEVNNIFEHNTFKKLSNEFPSEKYFLNAHELGNKKFLNNQNVNFFNFLSTAPTWKKFYDEINSNLFVNNIFNLCKKDFDRIPERRKIKKINLVKKKINLLDKVKKKINQQFGKFDVRLGFEFSLMKHKSYIPPHNDVENKLISLLIYFPSNECRERDTLGTNYYKPKKESMDVWKGEMMNEIDSKKFYENYSLFHHTSFEENKLSGFIKTKNSWHDVSEVKLETTLRKSVIINLLKL